MIALSVLALLASGIAALPLRGGEESPSETASHRSIAVLAFRDLETFETRMAYILEHLRGERTGRSFAEWVAQFSGIADRGVARDRPLGLILRADGGLFLFFPVEDRDRAHAAFEAVFPDREAVGTTGVYRIEGPGPMFVRVCSRWGYVGLRERPLVSRLPRPESLVPVEAARHDIFLRVNVGVLASLRRRQDRATIVDSRVLGAGARPFIEEVLAGGERLELGVDLGEGLTGELRLSARPESRLGRSLRSLSARESRFSLPESSDSLLDLRLTVPVSLLGRGLPGAAEKNAGLRSAFPVWDLSGPAPFRRTLLRHAWTALRTRLEGQSLDLALSVHKSPGGDLELVLGVYLPGAASLDAWLRRNLPVLGKLNLVREFESAGSLRGLSLHRIRLVGLDGGPFGPDSSLLVGIGDEVVYVAVGAEDIALVQTLMQEPAPAGAEEREEARGAICLQAEPGPLLEALADCVDVPLVERPRAAVAPARGRLRILVEVDGEILRLSCEVGESVLAPLVQTLGCSLAPSLLPDPAGAE